MNGRHQKKALPRAETLARVFEITRLQNDRAGFHDEHAARDDQDERLMDQHSRQSKRATQRKRTSIPHEHLRWMAIEPKKTEGRAAKGRAENCQFARAGHIRYLQIARVLDVARDIS